MYRLSAIVCLGGMLSGAASARGSVVPIDSPAGFSGSEAIVAFEGLPGHTLVDDEFAGMGVTFSLADGNVPRSGLTLTPRQFGPPGFAVINNFPDQSSAPYPALEIHFSEPVNRVGFEVRSQDGDDILVRAYSAGSGEVIVDEWIVTGLDFNFFAFESTEPFDELTLEATDLAGGGLIIDNLRFESVVLPVAGDVNSDGTITPADHATFTECLTGPAGGVPVDCSPADFDEDGDVDLVDVSAFVHVYQLSN